ncbi:MAG: aldehyde dehydrogenase family protein [Nitrososphaerales archaeon]
MQVSGIRLGKIFDNIYEVEGGGVPRFKNLIGGKWVESATKRTINVMSPIDNSLVARVQDCDARDTDYAITAAYAARQSIRDVPGIERLEFLEEVRSVMKEHRHDFVSMLMLEAGKPRKDAEGEVKASMERIELSMEEARGIFGEYLPGDWSPDTIGKMALVIREPLGVVTTISPFNYPLFIALAKIVPAILGGNTVVSKPSSVTPLSLTLFARVMQEAGLPDGVFNVVTGAAGNVGDALVYDERVSMVNFTGSTEVGRRIASRAGLKRLHLELGGKGMAIVLDDADLDLAAKSCVDGAFKNAGQRCDAVSAVLVLESVAEEFVEKVQRHAASWKMGDPRERDVNLGPLITEDAAVRVEEFVNDAVQNGAKLLRGGKRHGRYFEPTVLDAVSLDSRIACDETFGPVVTIIRIKSEEEAIEIGHRSNYGLDSCVFSNNFYRMWKIAKRLQVGEITINDLPKHGIGYFPFGGVKYSGLGREGLGYSVKEMTTLKTIVFNLDPGKLGTPKKIVKD